MLTKGLPEAIDAFKAANVSGMIIDLRNNGGGLVDTCVKMADLILPEGVVVSMKDKNGNVTEEKIDDEYYDVPMVVLVNGYSASASEILAGAIRDYKAGTLVGTKTFGKGIVQSSLEFVDGSGMKVTTARYYTPSGECIHGVGIEPDVEIELDEDAVTRYGINNLPHDHDAQLQKAIELLGGTPCWQRQRRMKRRPNDAAYRMPPVLLKGIPRDGRAGAFHRRGTHSNFSRAIRAAAVSSLLIGRMRTR